MPCRRATKETKGRSASQLLHRNHENGLENELAEIFTAEDLAEVLTHRFRVDRHGLSGQRRRLETDVFKEPLKNRVKPAGSDVLRRLIHLKCAVGNLLNRVVAEGKVDALNLQQRFILPQQRSFRFDQDSYEVVAGEVCKFDSDWESALKLGHHVRRSTLVKCPGRDEQDVVRFQVAVFCLDGRAFDDWQQIPLHSLPTDVRAFRPES